MTRRRDAAADAYDCRTCGACCVPEVTLPFYVHVTRADLLRFTPRWREQHVAQASILTKVDPVGHCVCVALRGTVGKRVSCAIYDRRPDECRKIEAGSAACLKARRQAGVEEPTPAPAARKDPFTSPRG